MRSALTASVLVGLWSGLWVGDAAHANEVPKRGGTLNFAVVAEPSTTDCHATTTFAMVHPVAPQYSTLLTFVGPHDKIKIEGDLAQSWEVANDGLSYTFKLRRGVKFHDGSDFTSEDVKATYEASSTLRLMWSPRAEPSTKTSRRSRRPTPTRWCSRWRV